MRLDKPDCIVKAAVWPDDATVVLNDCDCEREAVAAAASKVSVEGLPNEDGEANCANVDSVELAKCSRSPVENENASGVAGAATRGGCAAVAEEKGQVGRAPRRA